MCMFKAEYWKCIVLFAQLQRAEYRMFAGLLLNFPHTQGNRATGNSAKGLNPQAGTEEK